MIKMMKHYVTNGVVKARVWYSKSALISGKECVTLYEKGFDHNLTKIFPSLAQNDTDSMTDYYEKDRVRIFPENPLWNEACARV